MEIKLHCSKPEVWGGIECTINRIDDDFYDQLEENGHYLRTDDITCVASLGLKKVRYPILWEHHEPGENVIINWEDSARRLSQLRSKGISPIAGLLHHGSGPSWTSLLDEHFPEKLARYAKLVAEQFPWIEYYTPVNEPLTTARFSGMYGLWYPHHRDDNSFLKMLLLQLKGVVLSMEAIRSVNPEAKLVQTEDLAKVHSTSVLAYQASFENERRWLTFDLLCGKVNKTHALWSYLINHGIDEAELAFFTEHACPPYVLGLNYYVTSERWLDEDLASYPCQTHGSNGIHWYADTEAVRANCMEGLATRIAEVYGRYQLPLAITECHIACTREEQLRWLKGTWDVACQANENGIPVKAVTAWALFGAHDWDSLLTRRDHHYECGAYDLMSGHLRPTLLAKAIRSLATTGQYEHPLLAQKGWWANARDEKMNQPNEKILIVAHPGALTDALTTLCLRRSIPFILMEPSEIGSGKTEDLRHLLNSEKIWAVINIVCSKKLWPELRLKLSAVCAAGKLPCMYIGSKYYNKPVYPSELTIYANDNNAVNGDLIMDLFLDSEQGVWEFVDGVARPYKEQSTWHLKQKEFYKPAI